MESGDRPFERDIGVQDDIRQVISATLFDRIGAITADTVAIFPYSGAESLDPEYCGRVGSMFVRLLAFAVQDGRVDPRGGCVAELRQLVLERSLTMEQLFTFAYLTERTVVDELALNDSIGATTEPWPVVAQLVRRGSFDLLAAYAERTQLDPSDTAIIDALTTLHTRPLFEAVLMKEVERAGRFGYPISLILFDVDNLSTINETHGYGVGDKILERLGILIRKYFRQHDWVARHVEDSMAVLLTRTDAEHANELAEGVRATVEERLGFTDHLTDRPVPVTVSAAVVNILKTTGVVVDADRLMDEAERAIERAKQLGRNRVECVSGDSTFDPRSPAPERSDKP
jgi:diguanylate cyclase (GGDEF)-like protein